jgi:hypothetical protein
MILQALQDRVTDVHAMRALGFCVGVSHARFMADRFNRAGIPHWRLQVRRHEPSVMMPSAGFGFAR